MSRFRQSNFFWVYSVASIVGPILVRPVVLYSTQDSVVFTVDKTERVLYADAQKSRYLIFTKNETFENTDEVLFGKFNSSDVYGTLKEGHRYKAQVVGVRIPAFSWYRNIISVKQLNE
jgi:hypothetical protein